MADEIKGLKKFGRDLDAANDKAVIYKHFIEHHGDKVIKAVINAAHAGRGPQDKPYPAYAEKYKERKTKEQGSALGNWLRGIGKSGNKGGMLDPGNFSWDIDSRGDLWLVWTAPDQKTGIYAEVHNKGLPIGRGGPVKQREFMHFEAILTEVAVKMAHRQTLDELAAQFSAGRTPR